MPAAAADTTEPCADINAQLAATGELTDNWYQDCVPQYGVGKAEFTIVPDANDPAAEFSAEFVPLDELPPEAVSTTGDFAKQDAFFTPLGEGQPFGTPISPALEDDSDPTFQRYFAAVTAPVTSIGAVNLASEVPAAVEAQCGVVDAGYANGWLANFASVDTTFSQTINGQPWNYTITATPLPTYFFGTFVDGTLEDWCVTDGTNTFTPVTTGGGSGYQFFALVFHTLPDFSGEVAVSADLGTFSRTVPAAAAPALADTGADILPLAIAAGSFTAFGLALLGFVTFAQRRRTRV